ncbi:hypothetical protein V8F20_009865, partial [Naviculisporaceae sp. PSN 640]
MHPNFGRSSGGKRFTFPASPKGGEKPSGDALANLQALNNAQYMLEASMRALKRCRWEFFSLWFKHFSTAAPTVSRNDVKLVQERFDSLSRIISQQTKAVEKAKGNVRDAIEAVHPEYYQQGDPTLMVGGVKSGWAHDFLDKVKVRLDTQTVQPSAEALGTLNMSALQTKEIPVKSDLWKTMVSLLGEFCALASNNEKAARDNQLPLYHDTGIDAAPVDSDGQVEPPLWRDRWNNRQPWFPLFVEWEAEYIHVPWEDWKLEKSVSASSGLERTRYGIDTERDLSTIKDSRTVSGRILILPQPSFALNALIEQLFSTVSEDELNSVISEKERKNLSKNVLRLPFLSAPLSGLTDHLLTLAHGTHIKPSVRAKGDEAPQAILEAVDEGTNPMFPTKRIELMGLELDPTPYGAQIHVATNAEAPSPFKPVTHGQLRFTKLNVIDKFGQAIHALQPRGSAAGGPIVDAVIPCVGEFYEVSSKKKPVTNAPETPSTATTEPHTAGGDDVQRLSEFIQLPPSINQPARLNAHFVKRESPTDPKSGWVPTTEWEDDHIWGWVVINYLDHGIQLFTSKGIFYREVRLPGTANGGRTGGVAGAKWLPFKKTDTTPNTTQLDQLIAHLTEEDGVYLRAFLDMINGALEQTGPAPGQYAEALNCIVGKPLALVNMGWSLELATPPNQNQSTLNITPPVRKLVHPEDSKQEAKDDSYLFPIKLGDSHREYDGLVGYFPVKARTSPPSSRPDDTGDLPIDNEFDLQRLYTYFGHPPPKDQPKTPTPSPATPGATDLDPKPKSKGPLLPLDNDSYPKLSPYFLDPIAYSPKPKDPDPSHDPVTRPSSPSNEEAIKANKAYTSAHNAQLQIFAAIIDPFQPVHGYSSFLPIKQLKLLDWTWQQALNRMTAFFHIGPLMIAKDVPKYNGEYQLKADFAPSTEADAKKEGQKVWKKNTVDVLPTGVDEWNWLQPYFFDVIDNKTKPPAEGSTGNESGEVGTGESGKGNSGASDGDEPERTKFMPIKVGRMDTKPRFEKGPYTAIEGYLQMRRNMADAQRGGGGGGEEG